MVLRFIVSSVLFVVLSTTAFAQLVPDAGRIQQELERSRAPSALPDHPAPAAVAEPARPPAPDTSRFLVKGFRITHTTAFAEAELLPLLKYFVGQQLTLGDLQRAANVVTGFYRSRGFFVARAYVPAQEITNSLVEIAVLEGKLDRLEITSTGRTRLNESLVAKTVRAALRADGLIRETDLERGMLLLDDLPGVSARAVLSPGATLGTSVITTEVTAARRVSGSVYFDNFVNKFIGTYRLGTAVNLDNPSGYGDQVSLGVAGTADDFIHGRAAYSLPLGYHGLRLGGAYSATRYTLCCEFSALKARGEVGIAAVNAAYPFIRSRGLTVYGTLGYDHRSFFNETVVGTTSDNQANVLLFGLNGSGRDSLGGGGLNSFELTVHTGWLTLGVASDRALDALTADTRGGYRKVTYGLTRLQRLGGAFSLYGVLTGQFAPANLDSSEKFILGGPFGVRAYPTGEAAGDEGLLLNVDLRYDLGPRWQLAAFIDHGEIRLHSSKWPGWQGPHTRLRNHYGLSGYGAGLNWALPVSSNFYLRVNVANRIGSNPGRDANDDDVDGTRNVQVWMNINGRF